MGEGVLLEFFFTWFRLQLLQPGAVVERLLPFGDRERFEPVLLLVEVAKEDDKIMKVAFRIRVWMTYCVQASKSLMSFLSAS